MKKITKIAALCMLTIMTYACQNNSVSLTGSVSTSKTGKISLSRGGKTVQEIPLDNDNNFDIELKTLHKGYYELNGKLIYLAPSFDLNVDFNNDQISFTGKGSAENTLLRNMLKEERKYSPNSPETEKKSTLDIAAFKDYLNHFTSWADQQFKNNPNLDPDFLQTEKRRVQTLVNATLLVHTFIISKEKLSSSERAKIDSTAFANFNWNDEALYTAKSLGYSVLFESRSMKDAYSHIDFNKPDVGPHTVAIALRDLVLDSIKNPIIKRDHLTFATQMIIKEAPKYADEALKVFKAHDHTKAQAAKITKSYNLVARLKKGNPSPKFVNYENFAGGTTSLDDLKGSYLYIDIWATWCGPCIKEIPSLKLLEKEYHAKNIRFVSISIDNKKAYKKWKNMVAEMALTGIQIITDNSFKSDFIVDYNIASIPRFILIDPDGHIVDANAPRPSSKKLKALFQKLDI